MLGVKGTTEEPLFIRMPSGVFACMARPRKHKHVVDVTTVFGKGTIVATQFHATDPRWYVAPSSSATVGLPAPIRRLQCPAKWPAIWPGKSGGGQVTCVNEGKFDVLPVFVVTGPCVGPKITNLSLPGAPSIGFNVTLSAGDVLTIGTDVESAVLVTSGSSEGASRRGREMAGSRWFDMPPGENVIEFTSEDISAVAGTLTVQWADAFLGL